MQVLQISYLNLAGWLMRPCTHTGETYKYGDALFPHLPVLQEEIRLARSAHDALQIARSHRKAQRPDWDDIKVRVMHKILLAKVDQHPYVRRKLLETGARILVEDSWRDDFWGWGPNKDGQNVLGRLWMEIRSECMMLDRLNQHVSSLLEKIEEPIV
jgi:ribA/ribD-fused uncharacterized protein